MKPLVAIIDWSLQPASDATASIETESLKDVAEVKSFLWDGEEDFTGEILEAHTLLIWHNIPVTDAALARLGKCRAIVRNGVGYDSIDVEAAARRGIPVCNVPDYGTEEVADHALALALALCRQLFPLDQEAKQLSWALRVGDKIRRLRQLTFGIIGLGRIGTAAALRAKAFGFKVCFYDPYLPNGADKAVGVTRLRTLDELLQASDVLSIHCPLTRETHQMIGERELALLKPSAFVVNTARGAIIKKTAILAALREGRLAGAGLDVVENEPLRTAEEASTPNLVVTCHAAFCSVEAKREMRLTSARLARLAVTGAPLENVVNGVTGQSAGATGSITGRQ